jgi:hypothetical protein
MEEDHRRALAVYLVPRGQPIHFYVWHFDLLSALLPAANCQNDLLLSPADKSESLISQQNAKS